jgi:hypothetical protein
MDPATAKSTNAILNNNIYSNISMSNDEDVVYLHPEGEVSRETGELEIRWAQSLLVVT